MPDLPVTLSRPDLDERLCAAFDRDRKIPRALADLGRVAGRDVLLVDGDGTRLARELAEAGARIATVPLSQLPGVAARSTDVVVAPWVGFVAGDDQFEAQVAAARHAGRPGARLLVVQDYGRDDVRALIGMPSGMSPRARDRDEWFLHRDFRIRVLHCWWTFESLEAARSLLHDAFADRGAEVAASLQRPRLAHKVAVYHRDL